MFFDSMVPGLVTGIFCAFGAQLLLRRQNMRFPRTLWYLLGILPFLAGGFHTCLAAASGGILLADLVLKLLKENTLTFRWNSSTAACTATVLGYALSVLWAADRGMAVFGVARYVPVLVLGVFLMQFPNGERTQFLSVLPLCGAFMTLAGCVLRLLPDAAPLVEVNGRLSGFLQYPNTFAAFLLAGIAVLGTKSRRSRWDWLLAALLIAGLFLSGSRTALLLLILFAAVLPVLHKKISPLFPAVLAVAGCAAVFLFAAAGTSFTLLGRDMGSVFVRLLYYKDALPVIARHPFGLGYMGYRALEATFQTSRYSVLFVHSGLLQLMLDIGWIPALLWIFAVGKTLLSSGITLPQKAVLSVSVCHGLVDFDLEFFLFWAILLLCLDWDSGKTFLIRKQRFPAVLTAAVAFALCVWLGLGDLLHQAGMQEQALKVTPFHTDALAAAMLTTANPEELDPLADRILALNPTHSLACSAKANAAFSRGNVPEMITYKEQAIEYAPYTIEEYCDYIEKLYTVMELYVHAGDHSSAVYCLEKLLSVPRSIQAVEDRTDPLAYRTGNAVQMELPLPYRNLLDALEKANTPPKA